MKRTFFHGAVVLSLFERAYVFGHRCADRYAFLIPVTTPNTNPPTIPQGVEPKRYVSHTQPNPPPTISAASRSVPIRTAWPRPADRKSTRLNSSHSQISYAVFCLK